jgi:hypothetical protein
MKHLLLTTIEAVLLVIFKNHGQPLIPNARSFN